MGYEVGSVQIYSNDGTEWLWTCDSGGSGIDTLVVSDGAIGAGRYTYSGDKVFLGLAVSPNATSPDFAIGTTFNPWREVAEDAVLYIVESENEITTFDLFTLNLSAGTHSITVKARASSYADSEVSNAVDYAAGEITFTIDGRPYYADKDMTWVEWVASEYNRFSNNAGTLTRYFENRMSDVYLSDGKTQVPIGAIMRGIHSGGGNWEVVMLNGICVLDSDTIMPTTYEHGSACRD